MFIIKLKKRRRSKIGVHMVYSFWYGDEPVYFGKSGTNFSYTIRKHFFSPTKYYPKIDILRVTKILVQQHKTMSDCAVYVSYYCNKFKPRYNNGKFERDELSINLPRVRWRQWTSPHMQQWKQQKRLMNEHKRKQLAQKRTEWRRQRIYAQQVRVEIKPKNKSGG